MGVIFESQVNEGLEGDVLENVGKKYKVRTQIANTYGHLQGRKIQEKCFAPSRHAAQIHLWVNSCQGPGQPSAAASCRPRRALCCSVV